MRLLERGIQKGTLLGTIRIPGKMPSQNEMRSLGVWAERKAKKKWRFDAAILATCAIHFAFRFHRTRVDQMPLEPVKRRIVVTNYRKRLLDNAAESLAGGAMKHVIDGLADAGAIYRDSEKWLEREYRQVQDKNERTEIKVYSIEDVEKALKVRV